MGFYDLYCDLKQIPFAERWGKVSESDILDILKKDQLNEQDFLSLLSPAAESCLEEMAQKAHELTVKHFDRKIAMYAPLYVSDHCVNSCTYCSFSIENDTPRKKLTLHEVEREGAAIAATGIQHLLLLTGESPQQSGHEYLKDCIVVLSKMFASVSLEVQPMDTQQYADLVHHGVSGLTVFQEVYNEQIYAELHRRGPKRNYAYRLDTPERGCQAGMKNVTIGALLGLDGWRKEVFFVGMHARYLQDGYPTASVGLSFPRIRPHLGGWDTNEPVNDKELEQAMLAVRLFMPTVGITLSTRECVEFRNRMFRLGVTHMSAASSTSVGGYSSEEAGTPQFETADERSVEEVSLFLQSQGYEPLLAKTPMSGN